MSRSLNRSVLVASLLLGAQHASALNIVITNDDGFETPNIQALYDALVAAGHDVILSAPYSGQSGTSGMIAFLRPIGPTSQASPGGTRRIARRRTHNARTPAVLRRRLAVGGRAVWH